MIHYRFDYPGDPSSDIYEMTRAEFQERFRPSHVTMTSPTETVTIPVGKEEINCDLCNAPCGDTVWVWIYGRGGCRGYCGECFKRMKKHCTKLEE